jgi:phosphoribosylanthranilate isomerase
VKVCGITRLEDAEVAAELGASAIGLVLWPASPRYINPERARTIVRSLAPFVIPVGVFVDQLQAEVNALAERVGLGAIQLHGNETPQYGAGMNRRVIRAIGLQESIDVRAIDQWPSSVTLLVDAYDPNKRGGTGRPVDWHLAAALAVRRPIILSGGLRPENVAAAIQTVKPYAIDVSSGVESRPGVKDAHRLRAFFEAIVDERAGAGHGESS